jgi:hypothetical protein
MSYTVQIVRAGPNDEEVPVKDMPERYDTIEAAISAADTEIQIIGAPGAVTYKILDQSGQRVDLLGGTLS